MVISPGKPLVLRVPGTDHAPGSESASYSNAVLAGKLFVANGKPGALSGAWPQFRGPDRDGISKAPTHLVRSWDTSGPRALWQAEVGEGYAGPVIFKGRVYLMDYDREQKRDALRCLSAQDGAEIWRYSYPLAVKRNHGMSRTVPTVTEQIVVAIGPKCHVVCLDATTGSLLWGLDLVRQFGATVPPWYTGQCPLIDNGAVILAPGGPNALLMAVRPDTGEPVWRCPNSHGWKMTHSSIVPMEVQGERMYVYCANNGVVGVSAKDGRLLWETTGWKISIATVPSPLVLPEGRILLSGGYNAGSLMLQLTNIQGTWQARTLFKLEAELFGATQHTPIFYESHIYGVRPDGRMVCLDLNGKSVWASPAADQFGLGPFLIADGLILAMNDAGLLRMIEATPQQYRRLSEARVLNGRESWGPLALADGRLYARDLTKLVCLDVEGKR
jgi:outer membrane protein assembly factor BamB